MHNKNSYVQLFKTIILMNKLLYLFECYARNVMYAFLVDKAD